MMLSHSITGPHVQARIVICCSEYAANALVVSLTQALLDQLMSDGSDGRDVRRSKSLGWQMPSEEDTSFQLSQWFWPGCDTDLHRVSLSAPTRPTRGVKMSVGSCGAGWR